MSEDEVSGIFDADFNPKFESSTSMKIDVNRPARLMRHPLENGSQITDHIVFDPIEIEVILVFTGDDMRNGYEEVVQSFLIGELLTVQTKVGSFENMVMDGVPHEETSDMLDALTVSLRMIEARFIEVIYTPLPRKASNSPTVKRGEQTAKPKQSVAYSLFGGKG